MTDNLEQRLRDAFEASAASVTPDSLDSDREHEMRQLLAETPGGEHKGPRRGVLAACGGLAAAAAVVGVLVLAQPQPHPVVASDPLSVPGSTLTVGSDPGQSTDLPTAATSATSGPSSAQRTAPTGPQQGTSAPKAPSNAPSTLPPPLASSTTTEGPDKRAASTGVGPKSTTLGGNTYAQTESPSSTDSSTTSSSSPTGLEHGPLPIPADLQAASGMQALPMPPSMGYTVRGRTSAIVTVHVDSTMQAVRYWNEHSPLGTWQRDEAGNYYDPNSSMVIGHPVSDATGDGGTFTIQADASR